MTDVPSTQSDPNPPRSAGAAEPKVAPAAVGSRRIPAGKTGPVDALTEEEQMALYEEALKEDDWGHQPC